MNAAVNTLYAEYLAHTSGDTTAAANLTLAAALMGANDKASHPGSLTPTEAATRLRINRKTLYGLCQRRGVRCYRVGRHLRIPWAEIERLENGDGANDLAPRFPNVIPEFV